MVEIPAKLTLIHENPSIPSAGENAVLLEWAIACKANTELYKDQVMGLRRINDETSTQNN